MAEAESSTLGNQVKYPSWKYGLKCRKIHLLNLMKSMIPILLVLILILNPTVYSEKTGCTLAISTYKRSLHGLNCELERFSEVPKNLDSNMKVLVLKDNCIRRIRSRDFARYSKLMELNLEHNNIDDIADDAFSRLDDLLVLNLDHNSGLDNLPILPTSLEQLSLRSVGKDFNISELSSKLTNLKSLKYLNLAENSFNEFPKLNFIGNSLEELKIDKINSDKFKITVAELAPLCNLKKLSVDEAAVNMKNNACNCRNLRDWINKYEIQGLNVTGLCPNNDKCPKADLSLYESKRDECLSRAKWVYLEKRKYWIVGIALALALVCGGCWYFCRQHKKAADNGSFSTNESREDNKLENNV